MKIESNVKLFPVIPFDDSNTIMCLVFLTQNQIEKYVSKKIIDMFAEQLTTLIPKEGMINKIKVDRIKISGTYHITVVLTSRVFTNRFGGGKFKIYKYMVKPSSVEIIDGIIETVKPNKKVVVKQTTLTKPKPKPSKGNTVPTTKNKTIRTKVISFPNHYIFSYDYSRIIRPNRKILPTYSYLSNVG